MRIPAPTRPVLFLSALAAVALPSATAAAGGTDRDHDRMPDRWERAHHLNAHRDDARGDKDRDGLRNLAEYRAHTDPADRDSDDDGRSDKAEHAGTVASFTGGVLTVTLFDGSTLSAAVTGRTEIECDDDAAAPATAVAPATAATIRHDDGAREEDGGDDDRGEDEHGDDDRGEASCTTAALVPGARVDEAVIAVTAAGRIFRKVELG